jgi:hypothetical protein
VPHYLEARTEAEKGRTQTSENWEAENTKKRWTEEENP